MPVNERLVEAALGYLKGMVGPNALPEAAVEILSSYRQFSAMDDEVLMPIAEAALARLDGTTNPWPSDLTPMAPYRFVDLPGKVVGPEAERVALDRPIAGGLCARIAVEWAAETPLLIGEEPGRDGVVRPMTLMRADDYIIPGATLRGLVRSGMEIVAYARLGAANLHHRFGLRDFEHPAYAERSRVSHVGDVKAGWLSWVPDPARPSDPKEKLWQITPLGDRWDHVSIADLESHWRVSGWVAMTMAQKYGAVGMGGGGLLYDFTVGFECGPSGTDRVGRRVTRPGTGRTGVLVFSGKPPKGGTKKLEYVFFDDPAAEPVALSPNVVDLFVRLNSKPSKNKPLPDGSFKELVKTLDAGRRVPVFYVGDLRGQGAGFAFGLTRLFKVPHELSVGEVLARHAGHVLSPAEREAEVYPSDFVEHLFGHVVERDARGLDREERIGTHTVARKGRIAFGFGTLKEGQRAMLSDRIDLVLMAPRASYAPFYLRGPGKDYSPDDRASVRLAGRKRYLPRLRPGMAWREILAGIKAMGKRQITQIEEKTKRPVSRAVVSSLQFLVPARGEDVRFVSEVRLHNVSPAELGAVLFVLTHGGDPKKPYRHMIGRARAFGAGQMRVVSARLTVTPNDAAAAALVRPPEPEEWADAEGRTGFCPPATEAAASVSHRPFIDAFIRMMRASGVAGFPDVPPVAEFLGTSDPSRTPTEHFDYMALSDFGAIRKLVRPAKPDRLTGRPGRAPLVLSRESAEDGRLLVPPRAAFWRRVD